MSWLLNAQGQPVPDATTAEFFARVGVSQQPVLWKPLGGGQVQMIYAAWPKQTMLHSCVTPNFILEGERGTGKSHSLRWDAHLKALSYPDYKYLILRRTMPELRKSHLMFLSQDMEKLGGRALGLRSGNTGAQYPNGSVGLFGHCETEADIEKYLSAEFHLIVFDEIVTFDWEMITRIGVSARVPDNSGLTALVRGGTNPLGVSAETVCRYFILRDVQPDEDPNYCKDDWGSLHVKREDCPSVDATQYVKRFSGLPEAYRKAWLTGEWVMEGAYFSIEPQHLIQEMPLVHASVTTIHGMQAAPRRPLDWPWMNVYRLFDYGFHDPAVCVWVVVLPNGREIAFREQVWVGKTIHAICPDMKERSGDMRVITTIADPTIWDGEKEMGHSMADDMEGYGIGLTKGTNDRSAAGVAIQQHLNQILDDGLPKLQIYEPGCPTLVRALRAMRVDKKNPGRIADHKLDHMPICMGYFCMKSVGPSRVPSRPYTPRYLEHRSTHRVLGSEGVRKHR